MARNIRFERYADDIVCHCDTSAQAERFLCALDKRMSACGLQLHPDKTKSVYGRDTRRQDSVEGVAVCFDFLGFRFKPGSVKRATGEIQTGFRPGISPKAEQHIKKELGEWGFGRHSTLSLHQLRSFWNRRIGGWINYYGAIQRSRLYIVLRHVDLHIATWLAAKHERRASGSLRRGWLRLVRLLTRSPNFFAHWAWSARWAAQYMTGHVSGRAG